MVAYIISTMVVSVLIAITFIEKSMPIEVEKEKEPNNESITDCWYCNDKWECHDRFFKGRKYPCTKEERLINIDKYKEWEREYKGEK